MTYEPDPQLVRDFACRAIQSAATDDVDYIGIGEQFGDEDNWPTDEVAYEAMQNAVYEAVGKATVSVSWPDEQSQDERDACVCGDVNCMPYWRPVHEQMNAMSLQLDRVSADFTKELLEQVCELATELDTLKARSEDAQDERDADDGECAWHELHHGLMPDPFGNEPWSLGYQLFHSEQCLTLPPGAVCWANHEPHRHWWPAEEGVYRIRPVEIDNGGTEDGPNEPTLTVEIQVRTGEGWADYNGPTVGDLDARREGDE
jgi:hypothetical protein